MYISNYLFLPNVEIEIRLGTLKTSGGKQYFDSVIDKDYFSKIIESLEAWPRWIDIIITNTTEFIYNHNNKTYKKIVDNLKNIETYMTKESIKKYNFPIEKCPFDVRFSINQELKISKMNYESVQTDYIIRSKSRKSFIADNFRYDLTYVTEINNNVKKNKYELEIEIIVNEETLTWDTSFLNLYIVHKVKDLMTIVEKTELCELKDLKI